MASFSLSYVYTEVYGIEHPENEWGLRFEAKKPMKFSSSNSNSETLKIKTIGFILDNSLEHKINFITIFYEKRKEFKNKSQCD